MKERKLKIIISLMSLAIISLIYIQYYWISVAFKIEEEKFDRNVYAAMEKTVHKLELRETAEFLVESLPDDKNVFFVEKFDGKHKLEIKKKLHKSINTDDVDIEVRISGEENPKKKRKILQSEKIIKRESHNEGPVKLDWAIDSINVHRKKLVDKVLNEIIIFTDTTSTVDRIKNTKLDSLLNIEFNEVGVDADYFAAVELHDSDSLVFFGDKYNFINVTDVYRKRLFPKSAFHNHDFLKVYFPDKQAYILNSMFLMLLFSVLIIIIIIGVFYKTIMMFINQKKLSEIKNDLINNITHEFKTPISTISLACEALNEPALINNEKGFDKYKGMIKAENNRLSKLVENLLNTALLEKGQFEINFEKIDIHEIIRTVVEKYKMTSKNMMISYQLEANKFVIDGDEFHLTNVVNNLVDNAVKYSNGNIDILVKSWNDETGIYFSVSDQGKGISKQELSKIFDTFYRVSTGNVHNVKGYGIGLSYVKTMVEAHYGTVSVESKLNEGSTFKVYLPYGKN